MATQPDKDELNVQEQIARIAKTLDEMTKTRVEIRKISLETDYMPRSMIFQAMLATAALLGAGAALAKTFFP